MKGFVRIIILVLVVIVVSVAAWLGIKKSGHSDTASVASATVQGIDTSKHSIDKADSIWVIVNKHRELNPGEYSPTDLTMPQAKVRSNITSDEMQLRAVAASALESLFAAATKDNMVLNVQSGFRSYRLQEKVYNNYVKQQGQKTADTQSARPGFSEHQTGLAVDVGGESKPECNVQGCFAGTPEGVWVAGHAYEYGFIIRYPENKQSITGYQYEPWHLRYVGTELSAKFKPVAGQPGKTLEEFFKVGDAPDYN